VWKGTAYAGILLCGTAYAGRLLCSGLYLHEVVDAETIWISFVWRTKDDKQTNKKNSAIFVALLHVTFS
jgi:hypothetical protein